MMMKKRNVLNSPRLLRLKKKKRRVFLNKILLAILGFLAIFFLLAYLSRNQGLNISSVEITGNVITDTSAIRDIVEQNISGKYLWLFPKTNILFYPKGAIRKDLSDNFKRLEDITFFVQDRKILKVSLSERKGLYIWCGGLVPEDSSADNQCYFMDKDGYVFAEAPFFSGDVYFKFYGSLGLNQEFSLGSYFKPKNFQKLITFKNRSAWSLRRAK